MLMRFSNQKVRWFVCTVNREEEIELKGNSIVSFHSLHFLAHIKKFPQGFIWSCLCLVLYFCQQEFFISMSFSLLWKCGWFFFLCYERIWGLFILPVVSIYFKVIISVDNSPISTFSKKKILFLFIRNALLRRLNGHHFSRCTIKIDVTLWSPKTQYFQIV